MDETLFKEKLNRAVREYCKKGLSVAPLQPPLQPGRCFFSRPYSYSVLNNALAVYYLGLEDKKEKVCRDLMENARLYQRDSLQRDDPCSFYWGADLLTTFYHKYLEPEMAQKPTLRNQELKQELLKMMWLWLYNNSRLEAADYSVSKTWYIIDSENHHSQRFTTVWSYLQILLSDANYRDRILEDGHSVRAHFDAWTAYIKEWCRERARKGLYVESSNGNYNTETLKGIVTVFQYAGDPELKRLTKEHMDLYWASWATEELNGVRGGAKSRVYPRTGIRGADGIFRLAWYYLNLGHASALESNDLTFLLSDYRIPEIVEKLALHPEKRGTYEVHQRILGLAEDEKFHTPPMYHVDPENGGLLRYTYCTPEFIMGSYYLNALPFTQWTMISAQNRFRGVIFGNDTDARVVVQCAPYVDPNFAGGIEWSYNQFWGVQKKGTMITSKLPVPFSKGAGQLQVWYHDSCRDSLTEENGWVFTETPLCFIAAKPVIGGCFWKEAPENHGGYLMIEKDESPLILEVASKKDFSSFAQFREKCLECGENMEFSQGKLVYTGLCGESLTFFADRSAMPKIGGETVNLTPDYSIDCPFLSGRWGEEKITLRFDGEEYRMNF